MERENNITYLIDKLIKQVDSMTPQQLQDWCDSKECYDYLNR